jgi:predicted O-linked N-acetylglucosamine transferase (SPINDLY family)
MLRRAIAINEDYPEGYVNLGTTLLESHRYEEAEACYRRAVALKPDLVDGHYNLGNTLKCLERHAEASTCFRRALELRPGWERALNNLGVALYKMGRMEDAEASLERAIESNPDYVESYANLGLVQHERGQLDKACETYDKALRIRTRLPQILSNYGVTLHAMGRLFEAEQIYLKALASDPEFPDALSNLGTLLQDMGRFDEAIGCYRRILELSPTHLRVRSRLLFIYNYLGSYSAKQYVDEAGRYGELARSLVTISYAHELPETQPARLRVGLVSGDLRNHPVGYFLEGVLVALSSKDVELYAYQSYYKTDELTSRIKPLFAAWRTIYDLGDSAAARVIRDDGIHVLIDMSGHTQHNRLPLFSWKPAPVQVSWLGYFATTGVAEIDYLIGDPYVTPAHETAHFAESIWTLPKSYWCFSVPACTLEVARLPATGVGYITFGCFNNLNKMNDAVVSAWARILYRVPGSRLYLKYTQLGDAKMRDITIARFAEHGICPERLILEGASSRAEYLACFNKVDIALDPFPYPGGTTTIEGLWMGVPFITKAGDRFLSHAGETIAHNAGLSDWIAEDEDEYVRMAVHHASDLSRLAELRAVLRDQVLKSPLFDASEFAGHFEQAMWGMWQRWQGGYQ